MFRTTLFALLLGGLLMPNPSQAQVTYIESVIDASFGTVNTTLADGSPLVAGTHYEVDSNASDFKWGIRFFANGGTIISSNDSSGEDSPILRMPVTGLTPGENYNAYAYFWDSTDEARVTAGQMDRWHWSGLANLTGETDDDGRLVGRWASDFNPEDADTQMPMTELTHDADPDNPGPITTDDNPNPPSNAGGSTAGQGFENGGYFANTVMVQEGDRYMLQADLGVATADSNGMIFVYIDDTPGNNLTRTWFDGIGYELATAGLEGDYTGDGIVDSIDYAVWRENLGSDESVLGAPGDGSGTVDSGDFAVWTDNYGASNLSAAVATPEPSAILGLLTAVTLGIGGARRR